MDKDKMFFEELDKITQDGYKEVVTALSKQNTKVQSFSYVIELDDEMLNKYNLNKDFIVKVNVTNRGGETEYHYKGRLLKPINHYIRPEKYYPVSTLTILQECIRQDTYAPDIRYLEEGGRVAKLKRIIC